jgi:predicted small secreted protein
MTEPERMRSAILGFLAAAALAGCETVEGFGQDVESAGGAIEREAQQSQSGM